METKIVLTTGDAAKEVAVVPNTIVAAANAGRLPVFARTLRGQRLFRLSDVLEFGRKRIRKEAVRSLPLETDQEETMQVG